MALHFSTDELPQRRQPTCETMAAADLDGLLIFRQASLFYPTGYGAMTLGETVLVTETGCKKLSSAAWDLVVKQAGRWRESHASFVPVF